MNSLSILAILIAAAVCLEFSELSTPLGKVKGVYEDGVHSFKGIPYAAANRWQAPKLVENVGEILDTTSFGPRCFQPLSLLGPSDKYFSEQCLFLNIWTPSPTPTRKLPVMVFVHGGAFYLGSGNDLFIEGIHIAKQEVVLVTFNYRLGFFGFLSHEEIEKRSPDAPANFGLLDQIAALRWIQKHISHFGGDPSQITVFGESAGAISIMYLLHSQEFQDSPLFQRAIIQSAVPSLMPTPFQHNFDVARKVASHYGCPIGNTLAEYQCLLNVTGEDLISGFRQEFRRGLFFHTESYPLYVAPMLDGVHFRVSPFTKFMNRSEISLKDPVRNVDIIIGTVKNEGNLFAFLAFPILSISNEFMDKAIEHVFDEVEIEGHSETTNILQAFSKQVVALYPPQSFPTPHDRFAEIFGDLYFECPTQAVTQSFSKSKEKIFRYVFSQTLENGRPFLGTFHGSELSFIFNKTGAFLDYFTESEKKTSHVMMQFWISFAKTGVPVAVLDGNVVDWEHFSAEKNEILSLEFPPKLIKDYKLEKCQLWNEKFEHGIHRVERCEWEHEHPWSYFVNLYGVKTFQFMRANKILVSIASVGLLIFIVGYLLRKCCAATPKKKKVE